MPARGEQGPHEHCNVERGRADRREHFLRRGRCLLPGAGGGQGRVGSPDTATAEPPVPRPRTTPVKVTLFQNLAFTDFTPKTFHYSPPPGGARRWAKVVLVADFSVTPGRQFDRTAQISPGPDERLLRHHDGAVARASARTWHVERDVTDDSALLRTPQPGEVILGNIVNATYTGVIRGSASLLFYPPDRATPPAETPDVVLPLPSKGDGAARLSGPDGALTETFTFPDQRRPGLSRPASPKARARTSSGISGVPSDLADKLQTFGGTAFREARGYGRRQAGGRRAGLPVDLYRRH